MLSIIIPSYCRPDLLHKCLQSVTHHAPPATEIIVVDDASPTNEIAQLASRFPGATSIRHKKRRGFCAAVNTGIESASNEIVELLNDDTEVSPNWTDAPLSRFDDPQIAAVAPLVLIGPQGEVIDSAGDQYFVGGVAGKRGHGQPASHFDQTSCRVFGASASSAFYRRAALLEVGGFPESFGAYFDDVDVAFRLQRAGYRAVFEPAARVVHQTSASHGRSGRCLLEQQSRNEERVFWRNIPGPSLGKAIVWHTAVLLGKAQRRWRQGALAPFIIGRLRVLADVPSILRHRRKMRKLGPDAPLSQWNVDERYISEKAL